MQNNISVFLNHKEPLSLSDKENKVSFKDRVFWITDYFEFKKTSLAFYLEKKQIKQCIFTKVLDDHLFHVITI